MKIEVIFGNSLPVMFGPFFYGQQNVHICVWFTFLFYKLLNVTAGHSGYDFPFFPLRVSFGTSLEYHDFHHYKNQGNYGTFSIIWDSLFQTNSAYVKYKLKQEKEKQEKKF